MIKGIVVKKKKNKNNNAGDIRDWFLLKGPNKTFNLVLMKTTGGSI